STSLPIRTASPRSAERPLTGRALLRHAEVPLQEQVLALGIPHDTLAVASKLRVVRREQQQTGKRPLAECLDHRAVTEFGFDLPVGRDRAEVDDADMPPRWLSWTV